MEYRDPLPHGCPPDDAEEIRTATDIFRLVFNSPTKDEDFISLHVRNPKRDWKGCSTCGDGYYRLAPEHGVLLVVTDERNCEVILGFFCYSWMIHDHFTREIMTVPGDGAWVSGDCVKSPRPTIPCDCASVRRRWECLVPDGLAIAAPSSPSQ